VIDPRDDALLNDLLDGRLAPAEAEALRLRIAHDPELRAAWDAAVRLRELLRTAPSPDVPDDFLERVHARIERGEESDPLLDGATAAATPREALPPTLRETATPPASRPRLRLVPFLVAAAAVLVVAAGIRLATVGTEAPLTAETESARARDSLDGRRGDLDADAERLRTERGEASDARVSRDEGGAPARGSVAGKAFAGKPAAEHDLPSPASGAAGGTAAPASPPPPPEAAPKPADGFAGPGGAAPPDLREPGDRATPPPSAESPSAELPPPRVLVGGVAGRAGSGGGAGGGTGLGAARKAAGAKAPAEKALDAPGETTEAVYLLEVDSYDAGRAVLASFGTTPPAPTAPSTPGAPPSGSPPAGPTLADRPSPGYALPAFRLLSFRPATTARAAESGGDLEKSRPSGEAEPTGAVGTEAPTNPGQSTSAPPAAPQPAAPQPATLHPADEPPAPPPAGAPSSGPVVLGDVVLTLTPEEAARLRRMAVPPPPRMRSWLDAAVRAAELDRAVPGLAAKAESKAKSEMGGDAAKSPSPPPPASGPSPPPSPAPAAAAPAPIAPPPPAPAPAPEPPGAPAEGMRRDGGEAKPDARFGAESADKSPNGENKKDDGGASPPPVHVRVILIRRGG
jgi:hypothetical protein